jgi:ArsR family transcriptional regulator
MLEHIYGKAYIDIMNIQGDSFFRMLGDLTRLRVLALLSREGELCVCELTHALDEIQPKISRHLALLREAGVVLDRRQGQWIYYRLNPELPAWAQAVLAGTAEGIANQAPFNSDQLALSRMPDRPDSACCA